MAHAVNAPITSLISLVSRVCICARVCVCVCVCVCARAHDDALLTRRKWLTLGWPVTPIGRVMLTCWLILFGGAEDVRKSSSGSSGISHAHCRLHQYFRLGEWHSLCRRKVHPRPTHPPPHPLPSSIQPARDSPQLNQLTGVNNNKHSLTQSLTTDRNKQTNKQTNKQAQKEKKRMNS